MDNFRMIEHTADIGIEATAATREGLAEQSGLGLKLLLYGDVEVQPSRAEKIVIKGNSGEETLVNWLNELLFMITDQRLIPATINVRHFTETEISAMVQGEPPDAKTGAMLREIKAVTHHQTRIDHDGECWRSRVYLDL